MTADAQCQYCNMTTMGHHEAHCPLYKPVTFTLIGGFPSVSPDVPQHGWICPRCGIVHAPWVAQCWCPPPEQTATTFTTFTAEGM
jgi:hypothetical protein